jgi:hypothetical protein
MLNRSALLAMVFTVALAPVRIPGQASNHAASRPASPKKSTPVDGPASAVSAPAIAALTDSQAAAGNNSRHGDAEKAPKSVSVDRLPGLHVARDWVDYLTLSFGGILVVIGFGGVWYARRTLRTIRDQLAEIRAAGAQTDRMIEHAGKQAEAALGQFEIARNSERAWVIEEIIFPKELPFQSDQAGAPAVLTLVAFRVKNVGKSVARIRIAKLNFHNMPARVTLAPEPDYGPTNRLPELGQDGFILAPGQQIALQVYLSSGSLSRQDSEEVRLGNSRLVTYGLLEYETLEQSHITQFCYIWHEPIGLITEADLRGFRKDGPPAYNRST